jgi:hypothetical protein
LAFLSNESGQEETYMQALDRGNDSLRVTWERFSDIPTGSAMPALAKERQGTQLPGLGVVAQQVTVSCPDLVNFLRA